MKRIILWVGALIILSSQHEIVMNPFFVPDESPPTELVPIKIYSNHEVAPWMGSQGKISLTAWQYQGWVIDKPGRYVAILSEGQFHSVSQIVAFPGQGRYLFTINAAVKQQGGGLINFNLDGVNIHQFHIRRGPRMDYSFYSNLKITYGTVTLSCKSNLRKNRSKEKVKPNPPVFISNLRIIKITQHHSRL